jgi:hypothetical protein
MELAQQKTASHPSRPAIPRAEYRARDGKTAIIRQMEVGEDREFPVADANRVRVMAQRLAPKRFNTRIFGAVILIWRIA